MKKSLPLIFALILACQAGPSAVQASPAPAAEDGAPIAAVPAPSVEREQMRSQAEEAKQLVVVTVNGEPITMYSLIRMMNRIAPRYLAPGLEPDEETTARIKAEALDRLIYEELAVQEAYRQELAVEPEAIDRVVDKVREGLGSEEAYKQYLDQFGITEATLRDRIERSQLFELVTAREIYGKVEVTEEDITAEYEKEKAAGRLRKADEFVVKDVLLLQGETEEATKARATELLTEIGEHDGDLGRLVLDGTFIVRRLPVTKERYPVIFARMVEMEQGAMSGVVKDGDSYHIFKVLKKEPARDLTLDEAQTFLENRLRTPAQDALRTAWSEKLKKDATIEIMVDEVDKKLQQSAAAATP